MVTISSSCFGQIARIGTRTRQRLSRGQGRPKAMASVLASRGLSRGKRPVTDQYRKAKRGEDDPFWDEALREASEGVRDRAVPSVPQGQSHVDDDGCY